jgi:hypothetical protein
MNYSSEYSLEIYSGDEGEGSNDPGLLLVPESHYSQRVLEPSVLHPTAHVLDEQEENEAAMSTLANASTAGTGGRVPSTSTCSTSSSIPIPIHTEQGMSHSGLGQTGPTSSWNSHQAHDGSSSSGASLQEEHRREERDVNHSSRPRQQRQPFQQQPVNSHHRPSEESHGHSWHVEHYPIEHTAAQSRRKQEQSNMRENISPRHNHAGPKMHATRTKAEHTTGQETTCGDEQEIISSVRSRALSMDSSSLRSRAPSMDASLYSVNASSIRGDHLG